jgi:hypothetical protein
VRIICWYQRNNGARVWLVQINDWHKSSPATPVTPVVQPLTAGPNGLDRWKSFVLETIQKARWAVKWTSGHYFDRRSQTNKIISRGEFHWFVHTIWFLHTAWLKILTKAQYKGPNPIALLRCSLLLKNRYYY